MATSAWPKRCAATGNLRDANTAVKEAIRLAPDSAETWITASVVALSARNYETAITASRRALAISPSNYAAMNNLGVALRGAGKKREGTKVLAEAARIDPDSPTARTNLTRAGLGVVRIAVMILLIPIGLLAHIGLGLYFVFAVASNVFISRYPDAVLRMERWATPIALFFRKRDRSDNGIVADPPAIDLATPSDTAWSAMEGRQVVRSSVVLMAAIAAWFVTVIVLIICFVVPGKDKLVVAAAVIVFAAVAMWPTLVLRRRRRASNTRPELMCD